MSKYSLVLVIVVRNCKKFNFSAKGGEPVPGESVSQNFEAGSGRRENLSSSNVPVSSGDLENEVAAEVEKPEVELEKIKSATKKPGGMFRALRHRNFRLFWSGALVSNIGNWMQTVGQNWLVLSLTHSPFLLGLINFIGNAPLLLFGLFGGVVADRKSRKVVLLVTQSIMAGLVMSLAVLSFLNLINIWLIILIALGIGCVQAFNNPAYQSIMPELVEKEDLMNAIGLNSIQFNLTRIIGPSIAGALIVIVGVSACFFFNSLSFLAVIGALLLVRLPEKAGRIGKKSAVGEIKEGLNYIRGQPVLATLIGLVASVSILLFPYTTLLSVFAKDVFHAEASEYGIFLACVGVGAAGGAFFIAARSDTQRRSPLVFGGAILVSLALLIFASSNNLYLSMAVLPFVGGGMVIMLASCNTIVQSTIPTEMRGRVMSIYGVAQMGLLPLGNLQAGTVAQSFGAPVAVIGGTLIFGGLALAAFLLVPELKKV